MAAMAIGRAISGVYNKVMNFRSIDPGDPRIGLSSINQIDHTVWQQFFDHEKHRLRTHAIEAEFERLWGRMGSAIYFDADM